MIPKYKHKIMCGDSTSEEDAKKLMVIEFAEIIFTSPPYNAGDNKLGGNKNKVDNKYETYDDDQSQDEWKNLVQKTLDVWRKHSQYQVYNIQQLAGNKIGFWELIARNVNYLVDIAIWSKGGGAPAMAKNVMNSRFEFVFIFSNEKNPLRSIKTGNFHGNVSNVLDLPRDETNKNAKIHAATFPVSLPSHFIKHFTSKNAIVVDNFMGVGTTMIACDKFGRRGYGMELDPKYVDATISRYCDYSGNNQIRINGKETKWTH